MPSLIVAAAALDAALLAQNILTGAIAAFVTLVALLVAFSAAMRAVLLIALVVGLLIPIGVLSTSSVPGVAQVAAAKNAAEHWSDETTKDWSCAYRAYESIGPAEAARLGMKPLDCSTYPP